MLLHLYQNTPTHAAKMMYKIFFISVQESSLVCGEDASKAHIRGHVRTLGNVILHDTKNCLEMQAQALTLT